MQGAAIIDELASQTILSVALALHLEREGGRMPCFRPRLKPKVANRYGDRSTGDNQNSLDFREADEQNLSSIVSTN